MKKASFKINGLSCDAYSETAKDICFYSYTGMWAEDMKNPNDVNDVENFIGGHIRTDKASFPLTAPGRKTSIRRRFHA